MIGVCHVAARDPYTVQETMAYFCHNDRLRDPPPTISDISPLMHKERSNQVPNHTPTGETRRAQTLE